MCWIAAIPIAIAAVSAMKGAQAEKANQKYQAQVADANAQTSAAFAVDAIARGDVAAGAVRRKGLQIAGTQRARLAANGVDVNEGSAMAILQETDYFTRMDEATVKSNAAREAWGYKVQGTNYKNAANFAQSRADQINPLFSGVMAGASSYFGAGGGFGLGGGTVAPEWLGDGMSQGDRRRIGVS